MPFAQVALPLPLRRTFTYAVPDELDARVRPGVEVQVPFRGRARKGFVVERARENPLPPGTKVQAITAPLGGTVFTPHMLAFTHWISEYYLAPWGEVLAAALPGGLEGFAKSRARKGAEEDRVSALALRERMTLTAGQRDALKVIEGAIAAGGFAPILLHGVTASGKTELYMRAAEKVRAAGKQTLILAPEVAIGSQLVREFRRRFGRRVGVLHSYLSVGDRRQNWELAHRGALDVIVGARSAVFAPLPSIGLIVVDEEHEPAYKQSEMLRYHGRDTAVRRAQMLGVPVLLGSATPSLESLANAARGKYTRIELAERVDKRALPVMRVVDLRRETGGGSLISRPLLSALTQRLERKEQAMLFLNRRGHSHHTQCRACGWVPVCPHCDIALTLHLAPRDRRCHYCDHREPATSTCPSCQAELLRLSGAGTQRAERELEAALPGARIIRLDTDVAREKARPAQVLAAFARGEADVLLGTQMIAKGLDFPRVTLVGVLDADVALHLPDFRAAERTFQLLVQVAGRAGRGRTPGEVLVQTCSPEHPAITAACRYDAKGFAERELAERREAGYPPFVRLATLLLTGADEKQVERAAEMLADAIRFDADANHVRVLGPAPQALARLRGRYRWHLLLKGDTSAAVRAVAARGLEWAESGERPSSVRVVADVDPVEVL
ncbi:MAG TPA: primosomal protein N' [Candidatus Eisenbacteria bacterium]|nr:primosomal protein N' [Candidatus Eisenbacteria bacterium]